MKKLTLTAVAAGAFLLLTTTESKGQAQASRLPWGSWQLVSNVSHPRDITVQFYNREGVLLHEEQVEGRRLNLARRKVSRQLDAALATAYQAWRQNQSGATEGKSLLARRTKSKKSACSATSPE